MCDVIPFGRVCALCTARASGLRARERTTPSSSYRTSDSAQKTCSTTELVHPPTRPSLRPGPQSTSHATVALVRSAARALRQIACSCDHHKLWVGDAHGRTQCALYSRPPD
eukprot:4129783-Prymnesium_polylepis.1